MKNKILTILYVLALTCLALTLSISLPIYFRPFYYMQIDGLKLVENTGYTKEVIIAAYNSVLNYLTLPGVEFSTGALKFSSSGASHFEDVKYLFDLCSIALIVSLIIVILIGILNKKGKLSLVKFNGKSPFLYAGIIALVVPTIIGTFAIIDFDTAFDVFHHICFPGKSNWLFDPRTDEIIKILPIEFFASCAAFIGVGLITVSVVYFIIANKSIKK